MAKISDMLRKVSGLMRNQKYLSKDYEGRRITPDETELNAYREKERLAKVKVDLDRYRKTDHVLNGFHLKDEHFLGNKNNMMKNGNCFKNNNPKFSLLKQGRIF